MLIIESDANPKCQEQKSYVARLKTVRVVRIQFAGANSPVDRDILANQRERGVISLVREIFLRVFYF